MLVDKFGMPSINERFWFGAFIITGYFATGWLAGFFVTDKDQLAMFRDMLLTVGPILGMIAQSIWKNDRQSNQQADTINALANRVPPHPLNDPSNSNEISVDATQANPDVADVGATVRSPSWRRPNADK